jgi:hypothetical protein
MMIFLKVLLPQLQKRHSAVDGRNDVFVPAHHHNDERKILK